MEITIVQGLPVPRAKNGQGGSGSKYDAVLEQVSVGDCVQFGASSHQKYFYKLLKLRGRKGATRKHDGMYCVWITA